MSPASTPSKIKNIGDENICIQDFSGNNDTTLRNEPDNRMIGNVSIKPKK